MANKAGVCSVPGCGKYGPLTKTWCHMHYARFRKTGEVGGAKPTKVAPNPTPQDLIDYWGYEVTPKGCWEANGFRNEDGYVIYSQSGRKISAHRASYLAYKGPIGDGMEVCHTCDNPACANPSHLYMGTHSQNMLDRSVRRRDPRLVLDPDGVRRIRELHLKGLSDREISQEFFGKVSDSVVYNVRSGKSWVWVK